MTEDLSLACQWGRCQDCAWSDDVDYDEYPDACLCHCHIDDPGPVDE